MSPGRKPEEELGGASDPEAPRPPSFSADALRLGSGTAVAQLVAVLASPILTRLYAPEVFGVLFEFIAITGTLSVIACLRYELAIMLPSSDRDAGNLLAVSLLGVLVSTTLVGIVTWVAADLIFGWLKVPELSPLAWMIPVSVSAGGMILAFGQWFSRQRRFGGLAAGRVIGAVVTTGSRVVAGLAGLTTGAVMVGAHIAGQVLTAGILFFGIWRSDRSLLGSAVRSSPMVEGIRTHRRFPMFSTWAALLNTLSWYLPVLILGMYFSLDVVGYYSFGFRILQMPMYTVGIAVSHVFFQRASVARREGRLDRLVENVFRRLIVIGLFPMLMLTLVGRELYSVVFGMEWAEAGTYTEILAIWAFFWFISSPMSALISVLERQRFGLWFNALLFATRFGVLVAGGMTGNARFTLLLLAVSGTLIYIYLTMELMLAAGVPRVRIAGAIGSELLYWVPFGVTQLAAVRLFSRPEAVVLVAIGLTVVHVFVLWRKHGAALFRSDENLVS